MPLKLLRAEVDIFDLNNWGRYCHMLDFVGAFGVFLLQQSLNIFCSLSASIFKLEVLAYLSY